MSDLSGRTTMVVGASRGLGRGIAMAFAEAGAPVVAVARTATEFAEAAAGAGSVRPVAADAADASVAGSLLDLYQPEILVLAAGASPLMRPLHQHTWESFSANWETDVRIAFHWLREVLLKPLRPGSRVVVLSSGAALAGSPLSGGYAGAKGTQRIITGYAQDEANRAGLEITFTAVLPKITPTTDLGLQAIRAYAARGGQSEEEYVKQMGPSLTPEGAGAALVDLVRTDASGVAPGYLLYGRAEETALTQACSQAPGYGHGGRTPVFLMWRAEPGSCPRRPGSAGTGAGTTGRRTLGTMVLVLNTGHSGRSPRQKPPTTIVVRRETVGDRFAEGVAMLVSVTGGTGYVGSHSVAALLRAGCHVRLLVRDKDAVARALNPLGADPDEVEIQVGDVLDPAAVERFVSGADAVLHAASVYSFDSRKAADMRRVNVTGTENVLSAAHRAGVERILYVSSVAALYPAQGPAIDLHSPVGRPRDVYMATKAEAEDVARRHQSEGAPVLISYPPALLGPFDPHVGDQVARMRDTLRGLMPIWPLGGFPVGDVRDTAAMHAAVLTRPLEKRTRFFGPGRYLTTRQYMRTLRQVTGRMLPAVFFPGRAMLPVGRLADLMQRVWRWHIPAEYGAVYICVHATPVADHEPVLGIEPRPVEETVADTVRWLQASGQLSQRRAGTSRLGG